MILVIGILLALVIAWQVRHLGLYLVLCDALGLTLAGVAAMAYASNLAEIIPLSHPLKGAGCMLSMFAAGWAMFRSVARSFAGGWAIGFGRHADRFGAMLAAFGGTLMFTGVVSTIVLTANAPQEKMAALAESLRGAAAIAVTVCKVVAFVAGGQDSLSLEDIIQLANAA